MKFAAGIVLAVLGTALFAVLAALFRRAKKKPFAFLAEAWETLCLAAVLLALGIVLIVKYHQ
ncbi:MAG: hypothetical protein LBB75_03240 [Oscillospiraceae bacterium]|nr:hypothetical protein [Oscillospiraceae bacterium]